MALPGEGTLACRHGICEGRANETGALHGPESEAGLVVSGIVNDDDSRSDVAYRDASAEHILGLSQWGSHQAPLEPVVGAHFLGLGPGIPPLHTTDQCS